MLVGQLHSRSPLHTDVQHQCGSYNYRRYNHRDSPPVIHLASRLVSIIVDGSGRAHGTTGVQFPLTVACFRNSEWSKLLQTVANTCSYAAVTEQKGQSNHEPTVT